MKKNLYTYILLALITLLGGFFRFYQITTNPPSLNIDEISFGYSAYSILKTGRDENGEFMPLIFKSTGDYKNPVPVYIMVPSVWFFGLNEFAVRFPTALLGTLSIPVFFFFLRYLFKKDLIALAGTFLFSISAWHIYFSRYAYDPLLASFFLLLGIWFFMKMLDGKTGFGILSAIFLVISMYSAFTERLFVPLFVFFCLIFNYRKVLSIKKSLAYFFLACFILVLPLIYLSLFGGASTRLGMIFLTQDVEYTRYTVLDHLFKYDEPLMTFFFWAKRYIGYFQPGFLFFTGLNLTGIGMLGLGVLSIFEIPLLILGIIKLIKSKVSWKYVIIIWILVGIFPASLTNNETSEGRTLLALPALIVLLTFGLLYAVELLRKLNRRIFKLSLVTIFSAVFFINMIQAYLIFAVHFPKQKGEAFMEGTKESVLYAIEHQGEYSEIVYDAYRGIDAPYIVNVPHLYILFYAKYDPHKFQQEVANLSTGGDSAHFDKYTIRHIDWNLDNENKGKLFISSPWSIPPVENNHTKILKKIYLSNGQLALVIATPK